MWKNSGVVGGSARFSANSSFSKITSTTPASPDLKPLSVAKLRTSTTPAASSLQGSASSPNPAVTSPLGSSPPAGTFFSSVISAAQNVTSAFRGSQDIEVGSNTGVHKRVASDSVFFSSTLPTSDNSSTPKVAMMGKGELSLASFGFDETVITAEPPRALTPRNAAVLPESKEPTKRSASNIPSSPVVDNGTPWKRPRKQSATTTSHARKPSLDVGPLLESESEDNNDRPRPRGDADDDGKRLTGFTYTTKKRNQDFHKLFRSLPLNDFLLDDFSCALNREILIQGRMYVSERNICFNSNILGWVTNLVISFNEVVGLEKKTTAGLFPNGIVIQTLHAKHSFASYINRDSVFDFLMDVWRQTTAREVADDVDVPLDEFEDAGTESGEFDDSEESSDGGYESESDVPTDDEFGLSAKPAKTPEPETAKVSNPPVVAPVAAPTDAKWPVANLGPESHAPTESGFDYEAAEEKLLVDETVNAPLGVVVNLLFGDNTAWISQFITEKEHNTDLKTMPAFDSLTSGKKRAYEYIKPLTNPMGPKQTRCVCTDTIEHWDLDGHVCVVTTTQTPDVPSGGAFLVRTRYNLSWADQGATRVLLTYTVTWSAKSWFKSPIEKGTQDGQTGFAKNLVRELNSTVRKPGGAGKPAGKHKKRTKSRKRSKTVEESVRGVSAETSLIKTMSARLTEEPVAMVPLPLWALIAIGVVVWWLVGFVFGGAAAPAVGGPRYPPRDHLGLVRLREEYSMWQWIHDRSGGVGVDTAGLEFEPRMHNEQDIREVIKQTELRIAKLKQALVV